MAARNPKITKIHVGCKQLGISSADRKALQLVETGKTSLTEMSEDELDKVLARLKRDGFKPSFKRGFKAPGREARRCPFDPCPLGASGQSRCFGETRTRGPQCVHSIAF